MHPAVDFYLESQAWPVQQILHTARRRLLALDDRMREGFKWNTPFYFYHREVFYLKPVRGKPWVNLTFVRGAVLVDSAGHLLGHDRRLIRFVRLTAPADLDHPAVAPLLYEALLLDVQGHAAGQTAWQIP